MLCAIVSSTFLKVALHEQWRPPRRGNSVFFWNFSLRSFRQRKLAKDLRYQDLLDAFFFVGIAPKKKALQKRNGRFCANVAQATAFEKAVQNDPFGLIYLPHKSKFKPQLQ